MNNTTTQNNATKKNNSKAPLILGGPDVNQPIRDQKINDQWNSNEQWDSKGEALVLLHHANARIMLAEERIAAQEKKIKELESLASSDALTGLLNRRGFENFFTQELGRTRRHNTFGSVMLLIDLDKFKEINDTHGHQAGDACLKLVAECLQKNIRNVDAAARIGGDEFAVMLSHTDPEKAANCVHQLKRALNALHTEWNGSAIRLGASVGIRHVSDTCSFQTVYLAADKALYNDKNNRRQAEDISMMNIA
jgi:diguanylate cyclase (GGDEF)-like protein